MVVARRLLTSPMKGSAGVAIVGPTYFYPDDHPEVSSVDGNVMRTGVGESWADQHDLAGTAAVDTSHIDLINIKADNSVDWWQMIYRAVLLFDTSTIPIGATILSAILRIRGDGKIDPAGWAPFGIVPVISNPASDIALVPADYQCFTWTKLSTAILVAAWNIAGYNNFILNAAGLANITPGGKTKMGLVESGYDFPNSAPPWGALKQGQISWLAADGSIESQKPRLEVYYTP